MTRRGLLLTMTEPPPAMEEEFNAWYDDEHLAERLAVTGFRSAKRWVADLAPGAGKYLAAYELDSPGVLFTPEYLARLQNQTPWSRRCLGSTLVFRRWACEQVEPGDADPHPEARALLLLLSEAPVEVKLPQALQMRRFVASQGTPAHIQVFELAGAPATLPAGATLYRAYGA
ncbi:MAG: hypothetical protein ACT4P4_27530 [Betaproteobacteria bacterium]